MLKSDSGITLWIITVLLASLIAAMPATAGQAGQPVIRQIAGQIETIIAQKDGDQDFTCRGEPICGIQSIPRIYGDRGYTPIWLDAGGLRPPAKALMRLLADIDTDGLHPGDYHQAALEAMIKETQTGAGPLNEQLWAELDVLLTDTFLLLSAHISGGRVNPETLHTDWILPEHTVDMAAVLDGIVTEAQMVRTMEQLHPAHRGYMRLREALLRLRATAQRGGWLQVPDDGPTINPGERSPRVLVLRHRLQNSGDLDPDGVTESPDLLDAPLVVAVRRFQARHGLKEDGLVGAHTLAELNVPIRQRIRQIELNLERWRWLPDDLGDTYLWVNTADFNLIAVADRRPLFEMRVVVGQPARRTPVFSAPMTYLVINPTWTVPPTIAIEDMLPNAIADPTYFSHRGIQVFKGWDEDAAPLDPGSVDWSAYGPDRFPFRLVQQPGPDNALGRIKFMFPNKFDVYLHDTPHRALFGRVQRDLSSGCIRVENAVELAAYLLQDNPGWSRKKIGAVIRKGRPTAVHLARPMPLHLLYLTAWVDEDDTLQFRKDIYGRDAVLDTALKRRRPGSNPSPEAGVTE